MMSVVSISVSVCLSVREHPRNRMSKRRQFSVHIYMAVTWSFCGGVAICYVHVFPVLWITSCFHIMVGPSGAATPQQCCARAIIPLFRGIYSSYLRRRRAPMLNESLVEGRRS